MDWVMVTGFIILDLIIFGMGFWSGKRTGGMDEKRLRVELNLLNEAYLNTSAELHEANKERIHLTAKLAKLAKGPARGPDGRFLKRKK